MFAPFFVQFDQGTWTFGAGQMFTFTVTQTYNPWTDEMEGLSRCILFCDYELW